MTTFTSSAHPMGRLPLPKQYQGGVYGFGILMMPVDVTDIGSFPLEFEGRDLSPWLPTVQAMFDAANETAAAKDPGWPVCYLTLDANYIAAGRSHRRPGIHVDGRHGHRVRGVLTGADMPGCDVWLQEFDGEPAADGDCSHLADQCDPRGRVTLRPNELWFLSGDAVHRSVPQPTDVLRQFARLTLPGQCWHTGYTANPFGVRHFGDALPARDAAFMGYRPN